MRYADRLIIGFLDLVETLVVAVSILFSKPFMLVAYMERFFKAASRMLKLFPRGLGALVLRSQFAYTLGNYDRAGAILFGVIKSLEEEIKESEPKMVSLRELLAHLYGTLVRIYLQNGRLDDAAHALIRACKSLGVDYLPDLQRLDLRTAQIIKAGMAAARLLDEGGFATLTVDRPAAQQPAPKPLASPLKSSSIFKKPSNSESPSAQSTNSKGAKILLFPTVLRS
jgi:tetratricopeptide (TPR) repeat protein